MGGRLDPAVAASRRAVRRALADVEAGQRVVVACSGGSDSMALAAATAFEGRRAAWAVSVVVVEHGLQPDSAAVAQGVVASLGASALFAEVEDVEVVRVEVGAAGGPEAAARTARYSALDEYADRRDAVVLLGHTQDDQAETVLLGLARGSGLRSLAGMRPVSGRHRRPFLGLTRAQTAQVCHALDLPVWSDPDNADARFARVRVRRSVLPVLEAELGPGVGAALARTAEQAAADVDALDAIAADLFDRVAETGDDDVSVDVTRLIDVPAALRRRVLRRAALAAGCPGGDLFAVHVAALDALVVDWHGQRGVDLPGEVAAVRHGSMVWMAAAHHG